MLIIADEQNMNHNYRMSALAMKMCNNTIVQDLQIFKIKKLYTLN